MSETNVVLIHRPVAVKYPDSGLRDDAHALSLWDAHMYDTGGEPLFSAEQLATERAAREADKAELAALRSRCEGLASHWDEERHRAAEWGYDEASAAIKDCADELRELLGAGGETYRSRSSRTG